MHNHFGDVSDYLGVISTDLNKVVRDDLQKLGQEQKSDKNSVNDTVAHPDLVRSGQGHQTLRVSRLAPEELPIQI